MSLPTPFTADFTQLWLEVPAGDRPQWEDSQAFSSDSRRWSAYLNQLCLSAFLPWLQTDFPQARAYPAVAPAIWEVVNGTAVTLGDFHLVLIPSQAVDLDELRVPQEWVDIPDWVADYYLAVQVKPDEGWINIWGGTTHHRLKTIGTFDRRDRAYCLGEEDLIKNLNALLIARDLVPEAAIRASVVPLPSLSASEAENLLQRLGSPEVALPRLQVPFERWGALLQNSSWRQQLYDRRLGRSESWSVLQWLQAGVSELAQQAGWQRIEFQPSFGAARGSESGTAEAGLLRRLVIDDRVYELRITPQGDPEARTWRFELRNADPQGLVPSGFTLRLLTEDLQPFENNQATATTPIPQLYVRVALSPGEGLTWEVEPVPENYDRETLRF